MFKLVKEIRSQEGELHFRRWRVLETRWGNAYVHAIYKSDYDPDPHDHPWNFWTLILKRGYNEVLVRGRHHSGCAATPGTLLRRYTTDFHKISLFTEARPTWTLVLTGPRTNPNWGYLTPTGFVNSVEYRRRKNGTT